jgi:hypothetical protein
MSDSLSRVMSPIEVALVIMTVASPYSSDFLGTLLSILHIIMSVKFLDKLIVELTGFEFSSSNTSSF